MLFTFDELQYLYTAWSASALLPDASRDTDTIRKIGGALLIFASDTLSPLPNSGSSEAMLDLSSDEAVVLLPHIDPYMQVLNKPVGLTVLLKLLTVFLRSYLGHDDPAPVPLNPTELRKLRRWGKKHDGNKNTSQT